MLSTRLWRKITETEARNPIFLRACKTKTQSKTQPQLRIPRPLFAIAALVAIAAVIREPQLLLLLFEAPIAIIMLLVASPALLPIATLLTGIFLAIEVVHGIDREKQQRTYELICSSTGSLRANWSFAQGIAHRGGWLFALRWGSRLSLRIGGLVLGAAILVILWLMLSNPASVGYEQLRVPILIALILILYSTHLTQTIVLSLIIGLFSSTFDLHRRDAILIAACSYAIAQLLPFMLAAIFYIACSRLLFDPHSLVKMLVETATAGIVIISREALIVSLWHPLTRRLNANREEIPRSEPALNPI